MVDLKGVIQMLALPIDPIILMKGSAIAGLIAELSYKDETKAVEYLRIWGEKKMPITTIHAELTTELEKQAQ